MILESAAVCPACRHHLRFDPTSVGADPVPSFSALSVEGVLRGPESGGEVWEYSVMLSIRNGRGEEISRQVVGVGALGPDDERTVTLVEVFKPAEGRCRGAAESADGAGPPAPHRTPAEPGRRPPEPRPAGYQYCQCPPQIT
ncbi:MAG: hypothetical protein R2882_03970 [Gemmatimonadales bacterium]